MMTFNSVHQDLGACNCINLLKAVIDTESSFTRCVGEKDVDLSWFKSFHALGRESKRELKGDAQRCKWRGVSVNKLTVNKAAIKGAYERIPLISPKSQLLIRIKYICIFKMKKNAGKVADTSRSEPNADHHTMFTCDGFDLERLEVLNVVPLEEF